MPEIRVLVSVYRRLNEQLDIGVDHVLESGIGAAVDGRDAVDMRKLLVTVGPGQNRSFSGSRSRTPPQFSSCKL